MIGMAERIRTSDPWIHRHFAPLKGGKETIMGKANFAEDFRLGAIRLITERGRELF